MIYWWKFIIVLTTSVLSLRLLRPLAIHLSLVDHPDTRKQHTGTIPLIGGLAMFLGFGVGILLLTPTVNGLWTLLVAQLVLICVGVFDDYHCLSANIKILAQIASALVMALIGGLMLWNLGDLTGAGIAVDLGVWAVPFTVFAVVGAVNAVNMIDGLDGLAGVLTLITFTAMSILAFAAGFEEIGALLLVFPAIIIAFLLFNLGIFGRRRKVFMGDAGSMFLGFSVAWFSILLAQDNVQAMSPSVALWVFAIPLFDTVTVMLRRIFKRQSPFKADRNHLHHILQKAGLSYKQSLFTIATAALVCATIGVFSQLYQTPERILFSSFLGLFGLYFWFIGRLQKSLA
tara:strand:+ start:22709 stop:23740 length:1032 start_codon:yes stop_codon:yes gene_type:complete